MIEFVLILAFYASTFAKGDSVASTTIPFSSLSDCERAGQLARKLETSFKSINFVCAERRKEAP